MAEPDIRPRGFYFKIGIVDLRLEFEVFRAFLSPFRQGQTALKGKSAPIARLTGESLEIIKAQAGFLHLRIRVHGIIDRFFQLGGITGDPLGFEIKQMIGGLSPIGKT